MRRDEEEEEDEEEDEEDEEEEETDVEPGDSCCNGQSTHCTPHFV
jgi:hypothetical protein